LRDLINQGRVDRRQAGNPYVERLIDMEINKMQESSPKQGLFDTRVDVGNPFNAAVNEARQRYNEANSMDAMPPEPPAIIDVQPAQSEAQYWRERLGTGFGGGSGADIQSSQATPVDRREFVTDYADSPMEVAANYTQVRNVRNNNPGNIKINKANAWQGRVGNKKEKTFETFKTPEYGVRALNRVVDANIKATKTFEEFVNRYASEPSEQAYYKKNGKLKPALQNYADALAKSQGIKNSKSKFPSNLDKAAWLRAIIKHEGGADALNYYTDDIINAGIQMK